MKTDANYGALLVPPLHCNVEIISTKYLIIVEILANDPHFSVLISFFV